MNLFLLFCLPTVTFLLVFRYWEGIRPPQPLLFYSTSLIWGLGAVLLTMPFRQWAVFTGDFAGFFEGNWFNNSFLGPALLFGAFYWRHRKEGDQSLILLRLTLWFASYFTFLGLSDFLTTISSFGPPELFFSPLSWVLQLVWWPILYLQFITTMSKKRPVFWLASFLGIGLSLPLLLMLSYTSWAWLAWLALSAAFFGTWIYLERFYSPLRTSLSQVNN